MYIKYINFDVYRGPDLCEAGPDDVRPTRRASCGSVERAEGTARLCKALRYGHCGAADREGARRPAGSLLLGDIGEAGRRCKSRTGQPSASSSFSMYPYDLPMYSMQVYKARLVSTGELVAVKIQRPAVLEVVSKDLYVLRRAAEVYQG